MAVRSLGPVGDAPCPHDRLHLHSGRPRPLPTAPDALQCRFTNLDRYIKHFCHFGQNSVPNTTSRFARSRHGVAFSRFLVQLFTNFRSSYYGLQKKSVQKSHNFWSKKIAEVENFRKFEKSKILKIENFSKDYN